MKLSIMQPYIFPYIGYFHLIEASDKIIFYDDVNFIQRGWINRNRMLQNSKPFLFTIPMEKASQNKLIKDIRPLPSESYLKKFSRQLESAYKKAPFFDEVSSMVYSVFEEDYDSVSDLAIESISSVYSYLGKEFTCSKSSIEYSDSKGMDKAERLIKIVTDSGHNEYVNPIGGQELYSKIYFKDRGVNLYFVQSENIQYGQNQEEFIPWLSIIDVLMFNGKDEVLKMLQKYTLV